VTHSLWWLAALPLAFLLDALLGDPQGWPHPVRWIGRWAEWMERLFRSFGSTALRLAGLGGWLAVVGVAAGAAWGIVAAANLCHPWAGRLAELLLLYWGIAARDLNDHALRVARALEQNQLQEARHACAQIVGRDTASLDEPEICRAAIETVAENLPDGVTAPLFWAALAGVPGLWMYKAASTLDSMWGHRDQKYELFGKMAALTDDALTWLPARLTAPLMCALAGRVGGLPKRAWQILRRDGRKHASPNAGLAEAAMAGSLGVRLGGMNFYAGEPHHAPLLGDALRPLTPSILRQAVRLAWITSVSFLGGMVLLRALFAYLF
jgi:adenosylcobinamide-phosphate synthase